MITAPDTPDWFDRAIRLWAIIAPFATFIFGRLTKGEINNDRLNTLVNTVSELEETVQQHGEQLAAQSEINKQFFEMKKDIREIGSKLDRLLGRMDTKGPRTT